MTSLEEELARVKPSGETFLTVGVFDGVHRGHRHLLDLLKRQAARAGCVPGVVTFRNHPVTVLRPEAPVRLITTVEERVRLLQELGIETVAPITFTLDVSRVTAREFVAMLQRYLRMCGMVVGPDFALGHNREGTPQVLRGVGTELGFTVAVASPYDDGGIRVSSTATRNALAAGDIATASNLLGRSYALQGEVVHGEGRGGSLLGYPTANVAVDHDLLLPGDGIYATWFHVDSQRYQAATSIGTRPTFGLGERTVEAFLLDFRGDLYQKTVRLEFVERLRDEVAFDTAEALKRQIEIDVRETRRVLGAAA
ncbi:MAG: bifunctional riboflavin kinase/FAD synthetase [Dehalococcoidia bacterium]|nr:bifunctional riboflavin kinase/FAD synthetase [Dehalococcoidia bacterium]